MSGVMVTCGVLVTADGLMLDPSGSCERAGVSILELYQISFSSYFQESGNLPFYDVCQIFSRMHLLNMLFKVVQPRPYLLWISTILSHALVAFRLAIQPIKMLAFLMSIQIILCNESFRLPIAPTNITCIRLSMPSVMFPTIT